MNIGVTGATGFVGSVLVDRLVKEGHKVRVLSRRKAFNLPADIEIYYGDLSLHDESFDLFVNNCDVIIHCAAEIKNSELMDDVHIHGTKKLLNSCLSYVESGKSIHWIQLSSVGVYGPAKIPGMKREVREDTFPMPINKYEISKLASDRLIEAISVPGFSYSIVRPSNILGAGMANKSFWQLCSVIQKKKFFYIGKSKAILTYIDVNDVVNALYSCISHPGAKNQIFNISSDTPMQLFIEEIARTLGVKILNICLPLSLIRLFLFLFEGRTWLPITTARVNSLISQTSYPIYKIKNLLGYELMYPMPMGATQLIERNLDAIKSNW
jgi:nucleoside-diphosphate-sugar epimerase